MKDQEAFTIADFLVVLFKRKVAFILIWIGIVALAVAYLLFATKTYRLSGTVYVGRFQGIMLEEGEFVGQRLRDYSFIKRALDKDNLEVDMPLERLQRLVTTEVVNEVKKINNVAIIKLTVDYPDREMVYKIFKAITDSLIEEHDILLKDSQVVFDEMEKRFWETEEVLRTSLIEDEALAYDTNLLSSRGLNQPASQILVQHVASEKRGDWRELIKDIHYIKIENSSVTRSYNTKLAAEPVLPDTHHKPKALLTLVLGLILATVAATAGVMSLEIYFSQVHPKLKG